MNDAFHSLYLQGQLANTNNGINKFFCLVF